MQKKKLTQTEAGFFFPQCNTSSSVMHTNIIKYKYGPLNCKILNSKERIFLTVQNPILQNQGSKNDENKNFKE